MSVTDLPRVAEVHAESWRSAYRGTLADEFLAGDVVAERQRAWDERREPVESGTHLGLVVDVQDASDVSSRVMGFAYVIPELDPTYGSCLDNLHMSDGLRGLGIGGQLLAAVGRALTDLTIGSRGLYLWVYAANVRAQRFYERHGARRVETRTLVAADGGEVPSIRMAWHHVAEVKPLPARDPAGPPG